MNIMFIGTGKLTHELLGLILCHRGMFDCVFNKFVQRVYIVLSPSLLRCSVSLGQAMKAQK